MLLTLVCVTSLVVLGAVSADDPPPKCCFEKEYTATVGEVGARVIEGHISAITGTVDVAYDFYRKRSGSKSVIEVNGVRTTMYTLRDFVNGYIYRKPAIGTCTYHKMNDNSVMYPPCVPDNSVYLGPSTFGYGSETLLAHSWQASINGTIFKIAVTEDCVPIYDAFYGVRDGNPTEMTFFFTNYHPGIDSLESLNVPDNCFLVQPPADNGNSTSGNRPVGRRFVRPM